jgi:adenine-specific DNA-methyltransferase
MSGVATENEAYLTRQLITYIGNKRALLDFIGKGIRIVQKRLGKKKLTIFDVFSGSGAAARYFKQFSDLLIVNDLERYSALINRCYLSNADELDMTALKKDYDEIIRRLSGGKLKGGLVRELYAPRDDDNIRAGERVFYTVRNAEYIDTARRIIGELPEWEQAYFLAPLLSEASIHANTSGVFKGFYKDSGTGLGRFGGKNEDALNRIKGDIHLPFPVFSNFHSELKIYNGDANLIAREAPDADVAYLDPPYNQHPYGSNYFMLNLILDYKRPAKLSPVSGIPEDWNRSGYNKAREAFFVLRDLAASVRAKFVLVSFNSEGFIDLTKMRNMLHDLGKVEVLEMPYNAFKGSRNLRGRNIHVTEFLYLLEKKQ